MLLNSGVLLLSAVIAHAIACGTFISLIPFAITTALLVAFFSLLSTRELKGLGLAFLVTLAQAGTHYFLGNGRMRMQVPVCDGPMRFMSMHMGSILSPFMMIAAHTIAGIASYVFASKSETFWNFVGYFLHSIFIPRSINSTISSEIRLTQTKTDLSILVTRIQSFLTEAASRLSAPPA